MEDDIGDGCDITEVHLIDDYARDYFSLKTILSVLSPLKTENPKTEWYQEGLLKSTLAADDCVSNTLTYEECVEALHNQFPCLKEVNIGEIVFLDEDEKIQWDEEKVKELEKNNLAELQEEVMSIIGWELHQGRARIVASGGTVLPMERLTR